MKLTQISRKIGFKLGLTREERRTHHNETIDGIVSAKQFQEEYHPMYEYAYNEPERHSVFFDTKKGEFVMGVSKKKFDEFKVGDKVKINYNERYVNIYDYVQPDFDNKKLYSTELEGHYMTGFEKAE